MVGDVLAAHLQGAGAEVHRHQLGGRQLPGDGAGDAAAAAAQVQDTGVHLIAGEDLLHRVHQHLRIHPGDEHIGGDGQGQAVKLPGAGDIGNRLSLEPAGGIVQHPVLHLGGGIEIDVPQQLLHGLAGGAGHQHPGFQTVGLHAVLAQEISCGQIDVVIGFQVLLPHFPHSSLPFSSGITSSMARMAHSIMPSSGSKVVMR